MNQNPNFNQNEKTGMEIDLVKLLGLLWRRAWLLVLCTVLCGFLAWEATIQFAVPQYRTSIEMYVYVKQGGANASEIAAAKHLVNTCGIYLKTDDVLKKVIQESGITDLSVSELRAMISYAPVQETEIFTVEVSDDDGAQIVVLANAIGKVLPDAVSTGLNQDINVRTLSLAPNGELYSPNYRQNMIIGAILGFLLSAGFVILRYIFDPYVKSEEDVSKVYGIPLLAVIPASSFHNKKPYRNYGRYGAYYGYRKDTTAKK